jgi:hypothetical protein
MLNGPEICNSLSDLTADALDAAHGLDIQFLRRQLEGGVAGVDTGKLDVLTDGISHDLAVRATASISISLACSMNLLTTTGYDPRDVGSQLEEALQLLAVGADIHGSTREDIRDGRGPGSRRGRQTYRCRP